MPRPGVTYLDVAKAATKLIEQNIRPSIEEVRKTLRTGSNSTINRHLKEWREKQGHQLEAQQGLPDTLLIAVKGIYEAIQEEASQKIQTITAEYTQMVHSLREELTAIKCENSQCLQREINLENALSESRQHASFLQKEQDKMIHQFDMKNTELAALQDRLQDKETEIDRLTIQLHHAQHNLDHYREAMRQQRDIEKQHYDANVNQLEYQFQNQKTLTLEKQSQLAQITEQWESLNQNYRQCEENFRKSEEKCHQQELLIQQQELSHNALLQKYQKLDGQHRMLRDELSISTNQLSDLRLQAEKSRTQVDSVNHSLKKAEDRIQELHNKNIFLTQEKTELATRLKILIKDKQYASH